LAKLRQYYIYKFDISKIKNQNYCVETDVNTARKNGELISVGDNQIFRFIRKHHKDVFDYSVVDEIYKKKNRLKHLPSSNRNGEQIAKYQDVIDTILFVPDVVNVRVDNKQYYKEVQKNGFFVNGIKFTRLCCGAGQARRNTVSFINESIFEPIHKKLMNGLDIKEINIAKLNAYYGLYMTAIHEVRTPRVCLINDFEMELMNKKVDMIIDKETKDGKFYRDVEEKIINPKVDLWDGQGLISPEFAKEWQSDLGLSFTPCQFVIRTSFVKGMLVSIDFKEFARDIARTDKIIDYYGKEWNVEDIDVILSASQFKMCKFYSSWDEYVKCCNENEHIWGVCKWNKQKDDDYSLTNYQYLQTLDLSEDDIDRLIEPTINWIKNVCNGDRLNTLLFTLGEQYSDDKLESIINRVDNDFVKAIVCNNNLINDKYIRQKIFNQIEKRILDAKIGRLWVRGNYQFMVSDPYAQCQFAFGQQVTGLMKEGEYYSKFWNDKGVERVDACRSPMVDFSEHNILNFKDLESCRDWFKYIDSGIIYNVWGIDIYRHSDSDWDGDTIFTTDNDIMINGIINDLNPITYEKTPAPVSRINKGNIYKSDLRSFDSKVGTTTNYSTSFDSLLALFDKGSRECEEIKKRIKLLRRYIGDSIDMAKGVKMKPFPSEWKKKKKINLEIDTPDEVAEKEYYNSLIVNKKPYFMMYIYNKIKKTYKEYMKKNSLYCREHFGHTLEEILKDKELSNKHMEHLEKLNKYMPVVDSDCVMNILCKKVESIEFNVKDNIKKSNNDAIVFFIDGLDVKKDKRRFDKVLEIFEEFNKIKRSHTSSKTRKDYRNKININKLFLDEDDDFNYDLTEVYNYIRNKLEFVCSNKYELSYYAAEIVYKLHPNKDKEFLWSICQEGFVEMLFANRDQEVLLPVRDDDGEEYLGNKYKLRRFD